MYLDELLYKKIKIKNLEFKILDLVLIILITSLGLYLRYKLYPFESQDYIQNLSRWWDKLDAAGGIPGLKLLVGNYTQPYVYLMALGTYLPWSSLTVIKTISVVFDLALAIIIAITVFHCTNHKTKALFAYCFTFLAPTVVMNSALWAQCDSVIMVFIALTILFFLKDKPQYACISFGIAMAIKIQSIFIAPVFLVLWMNRKLKFKHLLLIPLSYAICFIPTALAGGNYFDALIFAYWQVTTTANDLSFNCANMWAPIRSLVNYDISKSATLLALSTTFLAAYMCIRRKLDLNKYLLISLFLLFSLIIPFMLPHMHERYYYYAEIIAIVYAMMNTKKIYVPITIMFVSVFSYLPFLFNIEPINLSVLSIAILILIVDLSLDVKNQLNKNSIM